MVPLQRSNRQLWFLSVSQAVLNVLSAVIVTCIPTSTTPMLRRRHGYSPVHSVEISGKSRNCELLLNKTIILSPGQYIIPGNLLYPPLLSCHPLNPRRWTVLQKQETLEEHMHRYFLGMSKHDLKINKLQILEAGFINANIIFSFFFLVKSLLFFL